MPKRPEYTEFSKFLESTRLLLENQPPASDLMRRTLGSGN